MKALLALLVPIALASCSKRETAPRRTTAAPASAASSAEAACHDNAGCGPDAHCVFAPRLCGKGKSPGTCAPRPEMCDASYSPVCGCDGRIHSNECAAHSAGVDLDVTGACRERIPDWIGCGPQFCDISTSYCEIVLSDVFELPSDYACKPLPPACLARDGATPTCACFPEGTPCLSFCGPIVTAARSGFHLTCRK